MQFYECLIGEGLYRISYTKLFILAQQNRIDFNAYLIDEGLF